MSESTNTPAATPATTAQTEKSSGAWKIFDDLGDQFKQWGRSIKGMATSGQKEEGPATAADAAAEKTAAKE